MRGDELVGIVSERDLYIMEALGGADREIVDVSEPMTVQVYTTTVDACLRDVARVMAAERYGSALIMDRDRLAGIFIATDALRHIVERL